MKGREILDGFLVANEYVHLWNKARVLGLICRLGLERAYGRVDWQFLQYLLCTMGFGVKWRRWIKECTASAWFSILINGSPKGFFHAQRGLRQGDHFSPFFFVIVAEALSRMVRKVAHEGLIGGFRVADIPIQVSYHQFADDMLIF